MFNPAEPVISEVPPPLRREVLRLRFFLHYGYKVSPVDSGGRMSSIARSPFPRMSLRGFCFRACVCRFLCIMLLREGCVPWPSRGIPGGVAGVVSSELTKGYWCDSGIGCNFRDMVFAVRAWSNALSGCAEDGIGRWCGRRYQQCERAFSTRGVDWVKSHRLKRSWGKALRCDHTIDVCRGRLAKSSRVMDLCGHLQ